MWGPFTSRRVFSVVSVIELKRAAKSASVETSALCAEMDRRASGRNRFLFAQAPCVRFPESLNCISNGLLHSLLSAGLVCVFWLNTSQYEPVHQWCIKRARHGLRTEAPRIRSHPLFLRLKRNKTCDQFIRFPPFLMQGGIPSYRCPV